MPKYSNGAGNYVKKALSEMKKGELKSGRSGKTVKKETGRLRLGYQKLEKKARGNRQFTVWNYLKNLSY